MLAGYFAGHSRPRKAPQARSAHGFRGEWLLTGVERMLTWQRCRGDTANGGCRGSNLSRRMADMGQDQKSLVTENQTVTTILPTC